MTVGTESHSTSHSSGITTTTVAAVKDITGNIWELYILLDTGCSSRRVGIGTGMRAIFIHSGANFSIIARKFLLISDILQKDVKIQKIKKCPQNFSHEVKNSFFRIIFIF